VVFLLLPTLPEVLKREGPPSESSGPGRGMDPGRRDPPCEVIDSARVRQIPAQKKVRDEQGGEPKKK